MAEGKTGAKKKATSRKKTAEKTAAKKTMVKSATKKDPSSNKQAVKPTTAKSKTSEATPKKRKSGVREALAGSAAQATSDQASKPDTEIKLEMSASRQFNAWLAEQHISLAFSTYQTAKVFFVGLQPTDRLSIFERTFNRCMGLCVDGDDFYLSSLFQLWRFRNFLSPGQVHEGYDRFFVPLEGRTTGDLDMHDIAIDADGQVVFVNTLFSCLATLSDHHSFEPLWKPKFISKLAAEDRCHLNGLAMENGRPKYVTAISETDVADGWRGGRENGGVVIDVTSSDVIARGLSMPHSPRIYKGDLWLLNSGTGEFGKLDTERGKFDPITFCPGFIRGLTFHGDFAIVGLSKPRVGSTFSGLELDATLNKKNASAQCGLYVIDLRTGDTVHWLQIEGMVKEIYDVVTIPDARRPMALGFMTDEIRRAISYP